MSTFRTLLFLIALVFASSTSIAQDIIHSKRQGKIAAKVLEVNRSDVKYKKHENLDGPTYTIGKYDIIKIVYANGTEDVFSASPVLQDSTLLDSRSIIKVNPFSPYFNYIGVGYEQLIRPKMSWEVALGYAGLGFDGLYGGEMKDIKGGFIKGGIKFFPVQTMFSNRPTSNPLLAEYVRFEVAYSAFSSTITDRVYNNNTGGYTTETITGQRQSIAGMVTAGIQFTLSGRILCDLHGGLGLASSDVSFDVPNRSGSSEGQYFSHFAGRNNLPYAINIGCSVGYLLK